MPGGAVAGPAFALVAAPPAPPGGLAAGVPVRAAGRTALAVVTSIFIHAAPATVLSLPEGPAFQITTGKIIKQNALSASG